MWKLLAFVLVVLFPINAASQTTPSDTWVNVTFFPSVNFWNWSGAQNLHIRPYGFEVSGVLPATFINMDVVAHVCTTYLVNETSAYADRPSGLSYSNFPSPYEIFCRRDGVAGGLFPTSCDDGDTRPCNIQEIANLDVATIQRYQITSALEFSWFACESLDETWFTNASCDTSAACYNRPPQERSLYPECAACDWACEYGIQCFSTTGLPPLWYAEASFKPHIIPCKDENNCRYSCCSEQKRTSSGNIQYITSCKFTPQPDPQALACEGGSRLNEAFTASASILINNTMLQAPEVSRYVGTYSCDFPCTTSETLQITECVFDANNVSVCIPETVNSQAGGFHDKVCSTNFLLIPCDNGGTRVAFKNIQAATDAGQDPLYAVNESKAFHARRQCTEQDYLYCDPPVCLCLRPTGCPKHETCNRHGTYFEDVFDLLDPLDNTTQSPHFMIPGCVCEPSYSGRFCQVKKAETDPDCNRGVSLANEARTI